MYVALYSDDMTTQHAGALATTSHADNMQVEGQVTHHRSELRKVECEDHVDGYSA